MHAVNPNAYPAIAEKLNQEDQMTHGILAGKLTILPLLLLFLSSGADACSCDVQGSMEEQIERQLKFPGWVFVGVRDSADPECIGWRDERCERLRYDFEVVESLVGPRDAAATVITHADGATCGKRFRTGTLYLIYGRHTEDGFEAGLCTAVAENAPDFEQQVAYLREHRERFAARGLSSAQQAHDLVAQHVKPELSAHYRGPIHIRFSWHDLDRDGSEELLAKYIMEAEVPPPGVGAWLTKREQRMTLFRRWGESFIAVDVSRATPCNSGEGVVVELVDGQQLDSC